ncbi:MAG: aspartate carbamoyltransferase [Oscillospiraceae bacterium]|nr:aspartate carbamoyltransferase [Oscillospiraceae bacterium]
MRHLIESTDITRQEFDSLYQSFIEISSRPRDYRDALLGRTMVSLFYEPSTRTRFSFEAAMLRLGGGVFGFSEPGSTSIAKGESLRDTAVMVSSYADTVVCRHHIPGAARAISLFSSCPVINAGDGAHCHPTQTLTDITTLKKLRGGIDDLTIGLCGDLKYGRTVHSLLRTLARYDNVKVFLISPAELRISEQLEKELEGKGLSMMQETDMDSVIGDLDVLYMTRVQKERFADPAEYEGLKGVYILTKEKLSRAKPHMLILHPLPRMDEISYEVDNDPRAVYFKQAEFGMWIRMALLLMTAKMPKIDPAYIGCENPRVCVNPECITAHERFLPPDSDSGLCAYCEHTIS